MFAGIDAVAPDVAPRRDFSLFQSLYFVAWIVLGGFFLVNLFVGVIVDTFAAIQKEHEGSNLLDADQQQWVDAMEQAMQVRPERRPPCPAGAARALCWRVIRWRHFELAILYVILLNTALMGLDGYGVGPAEAAALEGLNDLCTAIFIGEAALKIGALSFSEYLRDRWCVFDFLVVCLSILEVLIGLLAAGLPINPTLLRALRVARVARVLRTVKSARAIKQLLTTLFLSLPAISNISSIFLILQFLFAVLGMQLFGGAACGAQPTPLAGPRAACWGEFLNYDANFCTFGTAFLTMFRCATGESWNGLMHDAAGDVAGGTWLAIPFFLSYVVLASFIVLNMMIAVGAPLWGSNRRSAGCRATCYARARAPFRLSPRELLALAQARPEPAHTGAHGRLRRGVGARRSVRDRPPDGRAARPADPDAAPAARPRPEPLRKGTRGAPIWDSSPRLSTG